MSVIADIAPHDSVERYTALGVEVLQGYAKLIDPWTVEVALADGATQRLTTRVHHHRHRRGALCAAPAGDRRRWAI